MNAIRQFCSAVAAVIVFVQSAHAWFAPPYVTPPSLPIGDEMTIRNWAVAKTNWLPNQWSAVTLQYTATNNQPAYVQVSSPVAFDTYDQYASWVASTAMNLSSVLATNGYYPPGGMIGFSGDLVYDTMFTGFPQQQFYGLSAYTNIGTLSTVTSNQFYSVLPRYEQIVVAVPQLTRFRIDISTNVECWNEWNSGVFTSTNWPTSPGEWTQRGFVAINRWCALAQARTRFTIVAGGQTNVYTQHGASLSTPPTVSLRAPRGINVGWIDITMPKGADVRIERSTDMVHWSTAITLPWSLGRSSISVPYRRMFTTKLEFLRAVTQ